MEFVLLPITQDDADEFCAEVNAVKDEGKYLFYSLRFTPDQTRQFILMHEKDGNPVMGAFLPDGRLVGWCDFSIGAFEEVRHVATLAMGVRKEFRGAGIGSALMAACIVQARELGIEKLELEVFASNVTARRLYEKFGFFAEGVRQKKRKYQGMYDDLVAMGLFL